MKQPAWSIRFKELREKGFTYDEIAKQLDFESFKAKHGGPITVDTIRCYVSYQKRKIAAPLPFNVNDHVESWVIMLARENFTLRQLSKWTLSDWRTFYGQINVGGSR